MLFVPHPEMGNELKFVKSKELKLKKAVENYIRG